MIQIVPQMRILVAVEAVDFRCGIDGLSRVCRERLGSDPFSGTLFVFRNRRGTVTSLDDRDDSSGSNGILRHWPFEKRQASRLPGVANPLAGPANRLAGNHGLRGVRSRV